MSCKQKPGIRLLSGVFLVFLHSKLNGAIDWSWWAVFAPLMFELMLICAQDDGKGGKA